PIDELERPGFPGPHSGERQNFSERRPFQSRRTFSVAGFVTAIHVAHRNARAPPSVSSVPASSARGCTTVVKKGSRSGNPSDEAGCTNHNQDSWPPRSDSETSRKSSRELRVDRCELHRAAPLVRYA